MTKTTKKLSRTTSVLSSSTWPKLTMILALAFMLFGNFNANATTCAGATVVPAAPAMPYSVALTCGAGNDISASNATVCGSTAYLGGNEAVFEWTPSGTYTAASVAYNGVTWTGIMIYAGCPTAGGTCVANVTSSATSKSLTGLTFTGGITYYIVVDTWPSPASPCPGTLTLDGTASLPCSGTPSPGNTTGPSNTCSGSNFTLGLQNGTPGTGVTYQWESADDAAFTINVVALGTGATQITSTTTNKYYRCSVTCSGVTTISNPLSVNVFSDACVCTTYCASNATNTADTKIDSIKIDGVGYGTSSTSCETYTLNTATGYSFEQGSLHTMRVRNGSCSGNHYTSRFAVYADYNHDGDFDDVDEFVYAPAGTSTALNSFADFTFTIPVTATVGNTRFRVVHVETTAVPTACGTYAYGETEDFCVDVFLTTACVGVPMPGNTIAPSSICPNASFNMSLQNTTTGSGVTYQWESADDQFFTLNVQSLGTAPIQTTSQTTDKWYRCLVDCGGNSAYSTEAFVTTSGFISCYCTPSSQYGASGGNYGSIFNVSFDVINNTTTYPLVAPYYTDYPTPVASITQGQTIPFSVNVGGYAQAGVWFDWDQSGTFDASEFTYLGTVSSGAATTFTNSITVPFTAVPGPTKMRFRGEAYFYTLTGTDACTNLFYGETEDYMIDVFAASVCAGVPTPGNTIASSTAVCPSQNITLTLQNFTPGTGITYQWESADDQFFTLNVTSLGTGQFQTTSQTSDKWYRCLVDCSGNSAYSTEVLVTTNPATQCYCTPVYTTGKTDGDLISNVVISGTTLSNNSGTSPVNPAYTYFDPINYPAANYTANLVAGNTYNVSVTIGSFTNQGVAVWIDYDDDGIFSTPSERIGYSNGTISPGFGTGVFPITLACNPPVGTHRMRVRLSYATSGINIDPCATYSFGETEDYDITVDPALPCPAPSAFVLDGGSQTQTSATFSWTPGCVETAWNLEYGPTGFTPGSGTMVAATTNVNALLSGLSCEQTYDVYLYADCSSASNGASLPVGPISVTTSLCPCVTPAPGNALANATSVCPTETFTLSLQNATGGAVVTYQWYVSTDAGVTYNPISGATSATYSGTQSLASMYYCDVTCSNGPVTVASGSVAIGMNSGTACYCTSSASNNFDEEIYNVTLNGNSTDVAYSYANGCSTPAPGPGSALGLYSNFTTLAPLATLSAGSSVPFSIDEDECDGATYYNNGCAIWIDFNQDGDFDDVDEEVYMETSTTISPRTISGNIAVPSTALPGNTRMRVIVAEGYSGTGNLTPCLSYGYGETEDYLVTIVPNNATLNATFFIQGYYAGASTMQSVLFNQGVGGALATEADDVTVDLMDATSPYAMVYTFTGRLLTNGTIACTYPAAAIGNSYYVRLTHRNSIETWSAAPVTMASVTSYDFSSAQAQAYGGNQVDAALDGVYSIYNGDVTQDGTIDIFDFLSWDADNQDFFNDFYENDFNGDGVVDIFDFLVWDPNNQNLIGLVTP